MTEQERVFLMGELEEDRKEAERLQISLEAFLLLKILAELERK